MTLPNASPTAPRDNAALVPEATARESVPSWVRTFCAAPESGRQELTKPRALLWRGEPYVVATNGHRMIALRGTYDAPPCEKLPPESYTRIFDSTLALPPRAVRVSALRAFCGVPVAPPPICATCGTKGRVSCTDCDGEGMSECECDCGDVHESSCQTCRGDCTVKCPDCVGSRDVGCQPVRIGGEVFNRWLLAEVVRALPTPPNDAPVQWMDSTAEGDKHVAAGIVGDEWVAVLMPVRHEGTPLLGTFAEWEPSDAPAADAAGRADR